MQEADREESRHGSKRDECAREQFGQHTWHFDGGQVSVPGYFLGVLRGSSSTNFAPSRKAKAAKIAKDSQRARRNFVMKQKLTQ
jgi:hypothetical protein